MLYTVLTLAAVLLPAPAAADPGLNPEEYYRLVLAQMERLPQPPYVAYDVVVRASGAIFYVMRTPETGEASFGFSIGSALGETDQWWPAVVRTSDGTTSVSLQNLFAVTRFPALNATWGGIDAWMRFGMQEAPEPSPSPIPSPEVSTSPGAPPVIAVVRSIGLSVYRVRDGGGTQCDGGAVARLLHLEARDDASRHPATDVSIDTVTNRICTIRFHIERSELVDRDGYVELHLERAGPYYLVKRGEIAFTAGRKLGGGHIRLFIDYASVTFPRAAPPGAFVTPAPIGKGGP